MELPDFGEELDSGSDSRLIWRVEMPEFVIGGVMTVSCYTKVTADTAEEAIEEAKQRANGTMCYEPFGGDAAEECWVIDELDGEPDGLSVNGETNDE